MEFIIVIVSVVVLIGLNMFLRSRERNKIIDKGLDPSILNIYEGKPNNIFLYVGIILLGIALGAGSGILLAWGLDLRGDTEELMMLGCIVWIGISCFVCYYVSRVSEK